jgi:membrane-anchored glycerophosphoryl diester phosphodiesterase (GDPDase)
VVSGASALVVGDATLGIPVTLGSVWARLSRRFWGLLALAVLIGLATAISLATIFLAWFFLLVIFAVAVPAYVLEQVGIFTAIKRSWELTIKSFFRVLLIRLLAWGVGFVLTALVTLPFAIIGQILVVAFTSGDRPSGPVLLLGVVIASIGTYAASLVVNPFLGCVDGLLYTDRRMRAEGLDIELGRVDGRRGEVG